MILFKIKNQLHDSFFSLGLAIVSPLTINADARDYIMYLTNFTETASNIEMGRNAYSELTFDVMITGKDISEVQECANTAYEYLTSKQYIIDNAKVANISTVTNFQNSDDFDPTSGLNTVVISMRLNYITIQR